MIRELARLREGRVEVMMEPDPNRIQGVFSDFSYGPVGISSGGWGAMTVRRDRDGTEENVERYAVAGLQISGRTTIEQAGRQAVMKPGDFCVYDNLRPYAVANSGFVELVTVRVPVRMLAVPSPTLERVSARRIGAGHPVADAAAGYFARLAQAGRTGEAGAGADLLAQPCVELLRALVTIGAGAADLAADALDVTLQDRLLAYMRLHLGDTDLTAARLAAEHHISERQLYRILSRAGVSLGEWIRAQRLEQCRRELASARGDRATIASIASRWGFVSAPHFSRAFKSAYGMSPRQWRDLSRTSRTQTQA
ncbi:helix-turn-helix domain-containing protein [Actinacidiphila acididurans]|uniref:Helix-turn-helix domain-containing protein n=1 Tax=Actinacidiphila acididurans TaxID=2784346 RepID=A0ABS2TMQ6_9ACTN|nr:helix-turn-helix domain-containing protein [Actinacidiphila acididurans]MBM9504082.1 helix-turn-helix domain-containing protein [Actinacidiphila acididurans]